MNKRLSTLTFLALCWPEPGQGNTQEKTFPLLQKIVDEEIKECGESLKAHLAGPSSLPIPARCPISQALVEWVKGQRTPSFEECETLAKTHPHWPGTDKLRANAEKALFDRPETFSASHHQWFKSFPPLTGKGMIVYLTGYRRGDSGKEKSTPDSQIVQTLFLSVKWTLPDLQSALKTYGKSLLTPATLFQKATEWMDQGEKGERPMAQAILPFLPSPFRERLKRRLVTQSKPLSHKDSQDPGMILDRVRYLSRLKKTEAALQELQTLKKIPSFQAEVFWKEQNILARRLMEEKKYAAAHSLIEKHRLVSGENFANAQWLLGWLSLRFLKSPQRALKEFQVLRSGVTSPMSVARADYWLARTYEKLSQKDKAKEHYKKAADHLGMYYGQLAFQALHHRWPQTILKSSSVPSETKERFQKDPIVQSLAVLLELGHTGYAELFLTNRAKAFKDSNSQGLLVRFVSQKGKANLAVIAAKKSTAPQACIQPEAYPTLSCIPKTPKGQWVLVHSIIRQESRFDPSALSCAGAQGLMQLMPATARQTGKKHQLPWESLYHPGVNTALGSRHLVDLKSKFQNPILVIAAYNAGSAAVTRWIETWGLPPDSTEEQVDWIEQIPYAETRNYVQRVLENQRVYTTL